MQTRIILTQIRVSVSLVASISLSYFIHLFSEINEVPSAKQLPSVFVSGFYWEKSERAEFDRARAPFVASKKEQ